MLFGHFQHWNWKYVSRWLGSLCLFAVTTEPPLDQLAATSILAYCVAEHVTSRPQANPVLGITEEYIYIYLFIIIYVYYYIHIHIHYLGLNNSEQTRPSSLCWELDHRMWQRLHQWVVNQPTKTHGFGQVKYNPARFYGLNPQLNLDKSW